MRVVGRPPPSDPNASPPPGDLRVVSPGYFDVMRLRVRGGRLFTALEGAGSPRVLVVNETFAAGAVLGLLAAFASSRVLESFLYGITTDDRLTFVAGQLVLVAVALVACWMPARRATRIDPMDALRVE